MAASITMERDLHDRLVRHMQAGEVEQVAFLFGESISEGDQAFRLIEIYEVPPEGFEFQSDFHVALTDEVRAHVIRKAWETGGCLVEAHSHETDGAVWFSPSDLAGFDEWVPHVRWRLRGRPYVALVFGRESFDALVWVGSGSNPARLDGMVVDGLGARNPTNITFDRLGSGAYDR